LLGDKPGSPDLFAFIEFCKEAVPEMFPFVLHIFAYNIKSMGMCFHCIYNCRFLSTGASCAALADSFRLGILLSITQSEVCEAIWKTMVPLHIPVPTTEMLLAKSNEFCLKWNFLNCVGSIAGKNMAETSIKFRQHVLQLQALLLCCVSRAC
jgi:hypothetical protein